VISIQLKCQTSSQNKVEIEEIKKKIFYSEFAKNYNENLVNLNYLVYFKKNFFTREEIKKTF